MKVYNDLYKYKNSELSEEKNNRVGQKTGNIFKKFSFLNKMRMAELDRVAQGERLASWLILRGISLVF